MTLDARRAALPRRPGLVSSLRRLGATFLAVLHTRAELLARDLERERLHVMRLLLLGVAALFFLALGAITLTIFIIVLFWDSQRLVVIGLLTIVYLGMGAGAAVVARREAERAARPFSASLAELKKDRKHFSSH